MAVSHDDRHFITAVDGVPISPSPISNAVVVGGTCWISGQLSVSDDGRYAPGTTRQEAERAFSLVFRIAAAAGFEREHIVYVDLAFQDLTDLPEVNVLYGELFADGRRRHRQLGCRPACEMRLSRVGGRDDDIYLSELCRLPLPG